jgi:preprotein translocase subunit SecA
MSFISAIFGDPNQKYLDEIRPLADKINELEKEFERLSDEQLKEKTKEFRGRLRKNETLDDLLPEAFAAVREASKRTIGLRHFDVQILGGIVLHRGRIAEMKTGEGKTLVATLAAYLNALEERGVHIVTINDYLAKRDTNWMGAIYDALGLKVGCIVHDRAYIYEPAVVPDKNEVTVEMENLKEVSRKTAYEADITHGTNNEFGFDYLRDNMVYDLSQMAQRPALRSLGEGGGHNFAIVDEVDSILIDEARTPLIISAPDVESTKLYETFTKIIPRLEENVDYNIDEKMKAATLTDEGIEKVEKIMGIDIYGEGSVRYAHQLEQALRAHVLFKRDRDYIVKPARNAPPARQPGGNHGGGHSDAGGDGEVIIVDEFTGRLMFGRRYSGGLHQAIEAKEGVKVQQESRTLATITFQNYFRMYKKLAGMTGTAYTNAEEFSKVYKLEVTVVPTNKPMIRVDAPDRVYRTERGKFQAVVREIKERYEKGQPILVGTVSIEKNELLSAMLSKEGISHQVLNAKNHEKEAQIIAEAGRLGAVTVATNMAGRGVDIILGGRQNEGERNRASASDRCPAESGASPPTPHVVGARAIPFDSDWQTEHDKVVAAGGLHIIGTERHEARRIDNQLRGRAGRQGDPGSSQFFVSMEDDLMRIFGSDRIKRMMEALSVPEDQPIENKMISKAIESAQGKIEGYNFDIRKHVLEYDDVMNKQRETIYRKRKEILEADSRQAASENAENSQREFSAPANRSLSALGGTVPARDSRVSEDALPTIEISFLRAQILGMISKEIGRIVDFHAPEDYHDNWNLKEISEIANAIFGASEEEKKRILEFENREELTDYLEELAEKKYQEKESQIGSENMRGAEKAILLRTIDLLWMDHLDNMEHLRDSVRLRAYGQRDPLVEYKNEGHKMFQQLLRAIEGQVTAMIYKVEMQPTTANRLPTTAMNLKTNKDDGAVGRSPLAVSGRVGRNDPCPCGSGKKYKKCHGA